jgi:hypothetical protein
VDDFLLYNTTQCKHALKAFSAVNSHHDVRDKGRYRPLMSLEPWLENSFKIVR